MTERSTQIAVAAALFTAMTAIGLDVHLVGRIAPIIARAFAVPSAALAPALAAHQLGLVVGACLAGVTADRFGSVRVMFASLMFAALLTLATPLARNVTEFMLFRTAAGIGLGAASPVVLALTANAASDRWRGMAIGVALAGNPFGGGIGSLVAMHTVSSRDYQVALILSGCALLASMALLASCGRYLDASSPSVVRRRLTLLFEADYRGVTLRLGFCFFLGLALTTTLSSWQPTYFEELAHVSVQHFARVAVLALPCPILGMLLAGALANQMPRPWATALVFGGHALMLLLIGALPVEGAAFASAYIGSVTLQSAGQGLLNIIVAERYSKDLRATAYSAAATFGRVGAITGPWFGVIPLITPSHIAIVFAVLAVVPTTVGVILLSAPRRQTVRPRADQATVRMRSWV